MFTRMSQALGGLSLRYNTIFEGERIKIEYKYMIYKYKTCVECMLFTILYPFSPKIQTALWLFCKDGTHICAKHLIYIRIALILKVQLACINPM